MNVYFGNPAVGILASLLIVPVHAQAVDTFLAKGDSASAFFFDESGCVSTSVSVVGSDIMEKVHSTPGRPDRFSGAGATLFISQSDACGYIPLVEASCSNTAPLANEEFHVSRKLDTATLHATLECTDYLGGAPFSVAVDIAWVAVGEPQPQTNNFHLRSPGLVHHSRIRSTSRDAEASGTISDGSTDFIFGTSGAGSVGSVTSGLVNVTRPSTP